MTCANVKPERRVTALSDAQFKRRAKLAKSYFASSPAVVSELRASREGRVVREEVKRLLSSLRHERAPE